MLGRSTLFSLDEPVAAGRVRGARHEPGKRIHRRQRCHPASLNNRKPALEGTREDTGLMIVYGSAANSVMAT